MTLRPLVLLNIIHHHFQPAIDAAMIQVEAEAPNLQRLTSALVLPGINPRRQLLENLVVAAKQCPVEDFSVPHIHRRLQSCRFYLQALRFNFNLTELKIDHHIPLAQIRFLPGVLKASRARPEFIVPGRQVPADKSSGDSGRRHHTSGGNRRSGHGASLRIGNHAGNGRSQSRL